MAKKTKQPAERDNLLDQMEGDFPEAFRFEKPGDMIVGRVVTFGRAYSKYGPHPVVQIQSEQDGEIYSVHCMQTVLRNQMIEANPLPGNRVAVKYLGKETPKSGGDDYNNFRVRVDAPARSFADVAGLIPEREPEAADDDDDDDMPF